MIDISFIVHTDAAGLQHPDSGRRLKEREEVRFSMKWPWYAVPRKDERIKIRRHAGMLVIPATVTWDPVLENVEVIGLAIALREHA